MKKALSLILAFVLCLSLCACGKSKEVKNVESLITAIGEITVDSGEQIASCRAAYDCLSEEDKQDVNNYDLLIKAEEKYAKIAPVALSIENINEYLELSFEYDKGEMKYMLELYYTDSELKFETNPLKNGHFEDAYITIKIELNNEDWDVDSDDAAYNEDDPANLYVSFRLPANGEHNETHNISGSKFFGKHSDFKIGELTYSVVEVKGTFIPAS